MKKRIEREMYRETHIHTKNTNREGERDEEKEERE